MKIVTLMVLGLLSLAASAQDQVLSCYQGNKSLEIHFDHQNLDIRADLYQYSDSDVGQGETLLAHFVGKIEQPGPQAIHSLFSQKNYVLTDEQELGAILTIITKPFIGRGGCGRGSCDQDKTTAKLEYKDAVTTYVCF